MRVVQRMPLRNVSQSDRQGRHREAIRFPVLPRECKQSKTLSEVVSVVVRGCQAYSFIVRGIGAMRRAGTTETGRSLPRAAAIQSRRKQLIMPTDLIRNAPEM